jgi:hypothetical protein
MPEEIKVDAEKFDKILGRMMASKPLSKAEISTRVQTEREAKKKRAYQEYKKRRQAKKIGQ